MNITIKVTHPPSSFTKIPHKEADWTWDSMMDDIANTNVMPDEEPESNPITENRIGRFTIERQALEDFYDELMEHVFSQVVVVSTIRDLDSIQYRAYSPLFDPVLEGVFVPEYSVIAECAVTIDEVVDIQLVRKSE